MTLAHRLTSRSKRCSRSGFTLLEIIITLSIIAILMGSAFFAFSTDQPTAVVDTKGQIETLGSTTQRRSVALGRPHYVIIRHDAIWATELIEPDDDLGKMEPSSSIAIVKIPPEIKLSCKREDADWLSMTERTDPVIWVFSRSGLCESFSFLLEDDKGAAYEMTVNPITGNFIETDADEEKD